MKLIKTFKNKDLRKKLFYTIGILLLFQLGSLLVIPGVNQDVAKNTLSGSFLVQLFNTLSGGSLDQMSLFALGVSPYITAGIVIQLLSNDVIPVLNNWREQGNEGQKKLERTTRIFSLILAFAQAFGIVYAFSAQSSYIIQDGYLITQSMLSTTHGFWLTIFYIAGVMTAGSFFALWLGDRISEKGLGNGVSVIIFAGILTRIPGQFSSVWTTFVDGSWVGYGIFAGYLLAVILLLLFIVWLQDCEHHIALFRPSAGANKNVTYLPIKLNPSGVVPVIFASSIMVVPLQFSAFSQNQELQNTLNNFLGFSTWYSLAIYFVLILAFGTFYAKVVLDPHKISENLKKNGSYIPQVRPGKDTEKFINRKIRHLNYFGGTALAVIALIPYIIALCTPLSSSAAIGGTSIIILVGVLMEIRTQMEGALRKKSYEDIAL